MFKRIFNQSDIIGKLRSELEIMNGSFPNNEITDGCPADLGGR
jgi:hypothetical protein